MASNNDDEDSIEISEVSEEFDDSEIEESSAPRGGLNTSDLLGVKTIRNPPVSRGQLNLSEINVSGNDYDDDFENESLSSVSASPNPQFNSNNASKKDDKSTTKFTNNNSNMTKGSSNNNNNNSSRNNNNNNNNSSNKNNNSKNNSKTNLNDINSSVDNAYSLDGFEETSIISTSKAVKFASSMKSQSSSSSSSSLNNANTISFVVPSSSVNQAEVIVDELGREVARLRNNQKIILQERRQTALDKKTRADNRRYQYMKETEDLRARIMQLEKTNETLSTQLELSQSAAEVSKSNQEALKKNRDLLKEEYQTLKESWFALTEDNRGIHVKLEDEKKITSSVREEMVIIKDNCDRELSKFKALLEISHKSMESLEARMIKEREKLPDYQEKQLHERELRLRFLEDQIYAREVNWNAEEARRTKTIDAMRQDAVLEMQEMRKRAEEERSQQRLALETKKKDADEAELRYNIKFVEQSSILDRRFAELNARERQLDEQERKVERRMIELAAYEKTAEPLIRSIQMEESNLLLLKKDIEEQTAAINEKQKSLLNYESELRVIEEGNIQVSKSFNEERASLIREKRSMKELQSKYDLLNRETQRQKMDLYEKTIVIKEKSYNLQKLMIKHNSLTVATDENNDDSDGGAKIEKENYRNDMQLVSHSSSSDSNALFSHSSSTDFSSSVAGSNIVISDILRSCETILDRISPSESSRSSSNAREYSSSSYQIREDSTSSTSKLHALSIESKFMSNLQGASLSSSSSSSSKRSPLSGPASHIAGESLEYKASALLSPTAIDELRSYSLPVEQSSAKLDSFLKKINY